MNFCRTAEKLKLPIASPQTVLALRTAALGAYYYATLPLRAWQAAGRAAIGSSPVMILFYHRVADTTLNPWTTSTRIFERQIDWLGKHFDLISLEESQHRIASGDNRRPSVSITFDDGYADNCQWALPLLLERKIPFTYFVSSQHVLEGMPFPHDVQCGIPFGAQHPGPDPGVGRGRRRDRLPHPQPSQFGAGQRSGGAV